MTDDELIDLQNLLLKWLNIRRFASWKDINEALKDLLVDNPEQKNKYPAYNYFEPLLRNGIVEIAYDTESCAIGFSSNYKNINDINFTESYSTLSLLKNIPSVKQYVQHLKKVAIDITGYKKLNLKKFPPEFEDFQEKKVGIYKSKDETWMPMFLYDGKETFLIPSNTSNPDAYNFARCFVRLYNNDEEKLFKYKAHEKKLYIRNYSEHPYLVTRALYLSDKEQLKNPVFFRPINSKQYYNNILPQHISELKRIYNKTAIEVLYD